MLNMPDTIEQMMDTLLANPQYTQIFLARLQNNKPTNLWILSQKYLNFLLTNFINTETEILK